MTPLPLRATSDTDIIADSLTAILEKEIAARLILADIVERRLEIEESKRRIYADAAEAQWVKPFMNLARAHFVALEEDLQGFLTGEECETIDRLGQIVNSYRQGGRLEADDDVMRELRRLKARFADALRLEPSFSGRADSQPDYSNIVATARTASQLQPCA